MGRKPLGTTKSGVTICRSAKPCVAISTRVFAVDVGAAAAAQPYTPQFMFIPMGRLFWNVKVFA
jgi:hypothetical protein